MTRLLIWRHGRTAWNGDRRVQGQADVPLDDVGRAQAREVALRLARLEPVAIVTSDLRRAAETAAALAERVGLTPQPDPRLRERHFGEWQGLTSTEIAQRYPEAHARWRAGQEIGAHGVEKASELAERVAAALRDAAGLAPDGAVVVVATHFGAAKHGVARLLGWADDVPRALGPLENCHWIELRHDPVAGWRMMAYNAG